MKQILIIIVASLLLASCAGTGNMGAKKTRGFFIAPKGNVQVPSSSKTVDSSGQASKKSIDDQLAELAVESAKTGGGVFVYTEDPKLIASTTRAVTSYEGGNAQNHATRKAADGDYLIAKTAAENDAKIMDVLAQAKDPELALALLIKNPPAGVQVIEAQGRKLMFQSGYMFYPGGRRFGYKLGSFEYGAALGQMGISTQEIARMLQQKP